MADSAISRPMLGSVLSKTVRDQRRALVWWGVGLVATAAMYAAFYPSIVENAEVLTRYLESFPEALKNAFFGSDADFVSPGGYLHTELFGFFGPLLLLIYTIGAGARAIAGEEERKTLDILLATPVSRRRVLVDKATALSASVAILTVVLWIALVLLGPPFDLTPGAANLAAAATSMSLLALAFGAIALAVGSWTGRRTLAVGVAAGIGGATYLIDALAPTLDAVAWLQRVSPFYYYDANVPVKNGLEPVHALVLLAIAAAGFALALIGFERRDLAA
jgi:ABC-2 type transport system permease protein